MHVQAKQTNKLQGSYNEGVKPGRNRTDGVAMINVKPLAQMPALASICA
jgi:hypothetical protein